MPRSMKHPHVRGEDRLAFFDDIGASRNTPTCVGKTDIRFQRATYRKKHPHVRGEDTERLFTFFIEPSKQY